MSICEVYTNATLLVTGATGFVGKGFIEKILRTCTGVRKVIVLIRIKRNVSTEQRLEKLKNDSVFDRIRSTNPGALDKLWAVGGDIACAPNMDLRASDEQMIINEVNFVFHSGATVRFDLDFDVVANVNIMGTKRILDLCLRMPHLKSVVYVSTAYTGVRNKKIGEKLHPTKRPIDMKRFMHVISTGTAKEQLKEAHLYQDGHPNTYTLSKFFTEHLVNHYFQTYNVPVCIVRPSMVCSSHAEPAPGWVSGHNGAVGAFIEPARGAIRCLLGNPNTIMDIIPVDFVYNQMVVAAWWTLQEPPSELRIYNQTSSNFNPFTLSEIFDIIVAAGRRYPSKYTMRYPTMWFTQNRCALAYYKWVHQMIPAFIFDLILRCRGQEPMCVKSATMYNVQSDVVAYFRLNEFVFSNDNVRALIKASKQAVDHAEFQMDFRVVDIDTFLGNMWLGIRRYLLREDITISGDEFGNKQVN